MHELDRGVALGRQAHARARDLFVAEDQRDADVEQLVAAAVTVGDRRDPQRARVELGRRLDARLAQADVLGRGRGQLARATARRDRHDRDRLAGQRRQRAEPAARRIADRIDDARPLVDLIAEQPERARQRLGERPRAGSRARLVVARPLVDAGTDGRDTLDDGAAKNTEMTLGDFDLEWIVFDACQVLEFSGVFDRWGWPVFRGLHYILGFHTTCLDVGDRGEKFADRLNNGWSVRDAWIRACQETEGSSTELAYLRADNTSLGTDTFNDHWWGQGSVSADPVNPNILFHLRTTC